MPAPYSGSAPGQSPRAAEVVQRVQLWELPARRLPITVRPVPYETVLSYLGRLADANQLSRDALVRHLAHCGDTTGTARDATLNAAAVDRLVILCGRPPASLRRALPGLARLSNATPSRPTLRWTWVEPGSLAAACTACVTRRGVRLPVMLRLPSHHYLCLRHSRWLRGRQEPAGTQLDVSGLPDVTAAQRRHDNLVRRYGADATGVAHSDAHEVVLGMLRRRRVVGLHDRWDQRVARLGHAGQTLDTHDAALQAALYPEMVALSTLFASPHWAQVATSRDQGFRTRIFDEIDRRLGISYPRNLGYYEPVSRWLRMFRQQRQVDQVVIPRRTPPDDWPDTAHLP